MAKILGGARHIVSKKMKRNKVVENMVLWAKGMVVFMRIR